jgi:hypothetical protein
MARRTCSAAFTTIARLLAVHALDDLGKSASEFLSLQNGGMGVHDSWDSTTNTHQAREAVEGRIGRCDDGVPVNDG